MQDEEQQVETYHPYQLIKKYKNVIISFIIAFVFAIFYSISWSAPNDFPINSIYDLKSGQTLSIVSGNFIKAKIIKSDFWFKSFAYTFSLGKSNIIAGNYGMYNKQNVIDLAWRVSHGVFQIKPIKITIPEGFNSFEIADVLFSNFPSFDKKIFSFNLSNRYGSI